MDFNDKLGFIVTHKCGEKGTIIKFYDKYIIVDFGTREAKFAKDAFVEGFLCFDDPASQSEVETAIREKEAEDARIAEEKRLAEEKAAEERRRLAEENAAKKKNPVNIDDLFGKDYHVEHLKRQPILTYTEVERQFGIKISGFGRGINITESSIVLISSIDKKNGFFVYHDHWDENGDYIYSGEGQIDNQEMTGGNAAIRDAAKDGKALYLFVKLSSKEYYFQGQVVCDDISYEYDKDRNGDMRKEYKFRLRIIDV